MYKKMTSLFQSTAKYFAFDPKKYTMEEYFTDIKTFIESYNVSIFICSFFQKHKALFCICSSVGACQRLVEFAGVNFI